MSSNGPVGLLVKACGPFFPSNHFLMRSQVLPSFGLKAVFSLYTPSPIF